MMYDWCQLYQCWCDDVDDVIDVLDCSGDCKSCDACCVLDRYGKDDDKND